MGCSASKSETAKDVESKQPEAPIVTNETSTIDTASIRENSTEKVGSANGEKRPQMTSFAIHIPLQNVKKVDKKSVEYEDSLSPKSNSNSTKRSQSAPRPKNLSLQSPSDKSISSSSPDANTYDQSTPSVETPDTVQSGSPRNSLSKGSPQSASLRTMVSGSKNSSRRFTAEGNSSTKKPTSPRKPKVPLTSAEEREKQIKYAEKVAEFAKTIKGDTSPHQDSLEKLQMKQLGMYIKETDEKEGKRILTIIDRKCVQSVIHFHDSLPEKEDYPAWVIREYGIICQKFVTYLSAQPMPPSE